MWSRRMAQKLLIYTRFKTRQSLFAGKKIDERLLNKILFDFVLCKDAQMDPDDLLSARLSAASDNTSSGQTNSVENTRGLRVGPKISVERQLNDVSFP